MGLLRAKGGWFSYESKGRLGGAYEVNILTKTPITTIEQQTKDVMFDFFAFSKSPDFKLFWVLKIVEIVINTAVSKNVISPSILKVLILI